MRMIIVLSAVALLISACTDVGSVHPIIDGTYRGTFTIILENGQTQSGAVTFIFSGDTYSCVPQVRYLPPLGAGYFQTSGGSLTLRDTAIHTAEFDWTLILNGAFPFTFDGTHLVLQQNDTEYNRFRRIDLTKQ